MYNIVDIATDISMLTNWQQTVYSQQSLCCVQQFPFITHKSDLDGGAGWQDEWTYLNVRIVDFWTGTEPRHLPLKLKKKKTSPTSAEEISEFSFLCELSQ